MRLASATEGGEGPMDRLQGWVDWIGKNVNGPWKESDWRAN